VASAPVTIDARPADPETIELLVQSTPAKAQVFVGGAKLGDAPGPMRLPFGHTKVTITVKAEGHVPASVDVVPSKDAEIVLTLPRAAPPSAGTGETKNKDLENPF
jgi:hypothetical protein